MFLPLTHSNCAHGFRLSVPAFPARFCALARPTHRCLMRWPGDVSAPGLVGDELRLYRVEPLIVLTLAPLFMSAVAPGWKESRNCRIGTGMLPCG